MMYFPAAERVTPASAGFAVAEEIALATADGERVLAWHVPPRDGRPVIVYFHGNGGNLGHRVTRFRALADAGYGLMALSYRGYGGSSGRPSEPGIMLDAAAAYDGGVATLWRPPGAVGRIARHRGGGGARRRARRPRR